MFVQTSRPVRVIDRDTLRRNVPSVFAAAPWGEMSDRYRFIPTIEVIDLLADRGFVPVRAEQSRTRIEGKGDFTRHMIRLRHNDFLRPSNVGDEVPELILTNSHDGTSAYKFEAGIFRLVCSNGMVVRSADHGSFSVRHTGADDWQEKVIDATFQVMEGAPAALGQINTWKGITLEPAHREAYAEAAIELRGSSLELAPRQLLAPRRREDEAPDLWTTASVVQEHLMRGGDRGRSATGRRMRTRAINSVSEDLRLNRALWRLTEEMARLVTDPSAN